MKSKQGGVLSEKEREGKKRLKNRGVVEVNELTNSVMGEVSG